jgi:hypothetical protein
MSSDSLAYWMAICIPAVLLLLGSFTEKLIDGKPFNRKHFYVGLDLTIYFLATCFVNIADLVRDHHEKSRGEQAVLWTAAMFSLGMLMLFYQTTVHQEWEKEEKNGRKQFLWLCIASNGIGLGLLGAFVLAKWEGLI